MQTRHLAIIALVALLVLTGGVFAVDHFVDVEGEIAINASDKGPLIIFETDGESAMNLQDPVKDANTIVIETAEGEVTFVSQGETNATMAEAEMLGEWTNVSDLDLGENELAIDPDDKQQVNVSGDATELQFRDATVDDDQADFFYRGDGGTTNVTIHDVTFEDRQLGAINTETGEVLATAFPDEDGSVTFEELPNSLFGVEIQIIPWEMQIYDESNPDELIDDREITAEFFDLDGEAVFTESTTDGTISFENLTDTQFAVRLSTDDYADRQLIVKDIFEQQDAWLIDPTDENVETVTPNFLVEDETGQFDPSSSRVFIQRALNVSDETAYRTVASEEVGVDGYTETLEQNQRYRIIVENEDGDRRVLGKFSATESRDVILTVEEVEFNLGADEDAVSWNFSHSVTDEGEPSESQVVTFGFEDEAERTTNLEVVIFERGNPSNELHNETYPGPLGTIVISEPVDTEDFNAEWEVEFTAERNPTLHGGTVVGPRGVLDIPLNDTWQQVIAIGMILVVAGLGSQINAPAVGVATSGVAGIMWYIGFLPTAVTGGVIAFGFFIPALYIINRERGAT